MKGSRPEQAVLTRDTDMSKTADTKAVIEGMVDGLNDHTIDGIDAFFKQSFRWMGNAGCGTKNGLTEFQDNWQRPFQAAFSDKVCVDEARLFMGEWAAAFGRQEAPNIIRPKFDTSWFGLTLPNIMKPPHPSFWEMLNTRIDHHVLQCCPQPHQINLFYYWLLC